jgi:hypothetical protein
LRSEYDPLFAAEPPADGPADLDRVRDRFAAAGRPYLRSPWPWLAWAVLLPGAALATPAALGARGPAAVLLLWSATILAGGAVEAGGFIRRRRGEGPRPASPLARWVLRVQGNTSLVAVALSAVLLWQDAAGLLPGLWLLLLGHSFYLLGGLAFPPFRPYGLLYQVAGAAALWPGAPSLHVFAVAAALGNLWMAWAVWRAGRRD